MEDIEEKREKFIKWLQWQPPDDYKTFCKQLLQSKETAQKEIALKLALSCRKFLLFAKILLDLISYRSTKIQKNIYIISDIALGYHKELPIKELNEEGVSKIYILVNILISLLK